MTIINSFNLDVYRDGCVDTVRVGENSGNLTGKTKDCYITRLLPARAYGANARMRIRRLNDANDQEFALLRFKVSDVCNWSTRSLTKATLNVYVKVDIPEANVLEVRRLNKQWGITKLNAGSDENPATSGQATADNAFDYNGGAPGDVAWASGGLFHVGDDCGAIIDSISVANTDLAGTKLTFDITAGVASDILSDDDNYGYVIVPETNAAMTQIDLSSSNDADGVRPYLEITTTATSTITAVSIDSLRKNISGIGTDLGGSITAYSKIEVSLAGENLWQPIDSMTLMDATSCRGHMDKALSPGIYDCRIITAEGYSVLVSKAFRVISKSDDNFNISVLKKRMFAVKGGRSWL